MKKANFLAFLTGAAVMIIELCGARLIAPICGNTIHSWTAIIGVVLIALAIGNKIGGLLADKYDYKPLIGGCMALAGIATIPMPMIAEIVEKHGMGTAIIPSLLLFTLPALALGATSPCWVKMLHGKNNAVGNSAGTISMAGTLGSFVGTFATGFWLMNIADIRVILTSTGMVLCVCSIPMLQSNKRVAIKVILIAISLGIAVISKNTSKEALFTRYTAYHTIRVIELEVESKPARVLILDTGVDGGITQTGELIFPYQKYWELPASNPDFNPKRVLFIGAGAYGMPRKAKEKWPDAEVEVVEIDPALIDVGIKFFQLDPKKIKTTVADGRVRIREMDDESLDMIFGDAFNGQFRIPSHLTTVEFFELVQRKLKPNGVFMMNLIANYEPPNDEIARGIITSLGRKFPEIQVHIPKTTGEPGKLKNIIVMASNKKFPPNSEMVGQQLTKEQVGWLRSGQSFTDHKNPIDGLLAKSIKKP